MSQVRIVTDSTCDLPRSVAAELGITVVPLGVHFGAETYADGVDLTTSQFFQKLASSPFLPTTSAVPVGRFEEVYRQLSTEAEAILSVYISAKLSATYKAAVAAKSALGSGCPVPIEVLDSQSTTMGLGFIAMAAARAAREGQGLEEIVRLVHNLIPRIRILFFVDTLEYLQKGGRIGRAQAFLGTLLSIKPLLKLADGEIHPVEKVRTRSKAMARLGDFVREFARIDELAVVYSTTLDEAQALADRLSPFFPRERVLLAQYGPVIGVHVGPGALGVALCVGVQH